MDINVEIMAIAGVIQGITTSGGVTSEIKNRNFACLAACYDIPSDDGVGRERILQDV